MKRNARFFGEALWLTGVVGLLALCLVAGSPVAHAPQFFYSFVAELVAVFRDTSTQWVVFVCLGVYFVGFRLVQQHRAKPLFLRGFNPGLWLTLMLALVSLAFSFNYASASGSTQALVLLGGAALGSGALVWRGWQHHKSADVLAKSIGIFVTLFILGTVLGIEAFQDFHYRGKQRSAGVWDNPNSFGMLMAVGIALALGALVQGLRFKVQNWGTESRVRSQELEGGNIEHPTSNVEHRIWASRAWISIKVIFFFAAAGVMLVGLVKSYSRGAWLGAFIGISFLIYQFVRCSFEPVARRVGRIFEAQPRRYIGFIQRRWIPLALILVSIGALALLNFRHAEYATARRALSVANANDFSWRKRLSAYEGALQMIADKPWFGFGWNQPEPIYDRFYRAQKVDEGMAIQMNDYFTLGTTLGIPALACFVAYLYLSLRGTREHRTSNIEHSTSKGGKFSVFSFQCSEENWLRITCRAGAIVLLVGFFFDGGLFKLATGATFWILLELGSEHGVQSLKFNVQSEAQNKVQGTTFKVQSGTLA